jgi:PHD/YefM family antitoxin component YafN of YafNO toxin-antitoxin module
VFSIRWRIVLEESTDVRVSKWPATILPSLLDFGIEFHTTGEDLAPPLPNALSELATEFDVMSEGRVQPRALRSFTVIASVHPSVEVGGEAAHFRQIERRHRHSFPPFRLSGPCPGFPVPAWMQNQPCPVCRDVVTSNLMQILCAEQRTMLDLSSDINSLSNFKRNTPEFLRQLKETGHPVVLTINGKAELVVQDTASYQKLIELAERAERMDALKASLDDMKAGKVIPADDVLTEMRQILDRKQGR